MKTVPCRTRGGLIDLAHLQPGDVTAETVAESLAKLNRFAGRTLEPYSVATHSVLVSRLCPPEHRAAGLLHDAHEFLLGDLTTPALDLICTMSGQTAANIVRGAFRLAKARVDLAISSAFGVSLGHDASGCIARADRLALWAEMHFLLDAPARDLPPELRNDFDHACAAFRDLPRDLGWRQARALWLDEAQLLAAAGQMRLPNSDPTSVPLAG